MAYTKTVWKDYPDTTTKMTAQKLNNIEDGIEALDTGKVNKTDIADNLTTNDATKTLSAKQGKVLNDNKLNKTSITETSSAITLPDGTKIIYGSTTVYTFAGLGNKTETISLSSFGLTSVYTATVSPMLSYVDNQYMKDMNCYVHSKSSSGLVVNIVNAYPGTIGYYIQYIVIGK